ncbi:hypothetical protein TPR58_03800 [Sphingomonas sp. HF-S3]|uniref:Lipoprotein n=1 Tax=Sphingomonas rustica TaxID=3103142 RepID=A0ABV0B3Y2_9SPHN
MKRSAISGSALLAIFAASHASAQSAKTVPQSVIAALPAGHVVRAAACSDGFDPPSRICIVAAVRRNEAGLRPAPARPLLVYRLAAGKAVLIDRNDDVVLRADEGGQCDPFDDEQGSIAVSGRSFTVENGVACGQHWTDFITFRFDPARRAFLWRSEIYESWRLNESNAPDAEALVSDGRTVRRADPRKPIRLGAYRSRK